MLLFRRVASTAHVSLLRDEIDVHNDSDVDVADQEKLVIPTGVQIYEIDGPFFFGIANKFEEMSAQLDETPICRIIRMRKVPFVDATGLHNLEVFIQKSHQDGIHVILSGVRPEVMKVIRRTSLYGMLGGQNIFDHINGALNRAREVVDHNAQTADRK
jgi:SulP family sulfate permease